MLLVTALLSAAHAWVWVGTPVVTIVADRPAHDLVSGSAVVSKVRMHACGGGYTEFAVNQSVDPTEPFTVGITAGDWCGVSVAWGSVVSISTASGTVEYDEGHTSLELDGDEPVSVALTPYELVSGTWSGAAPRIGVTIE